MGLKVFIAGATGGLGRGLIRQFRGQGHVVVGLVRRPEGERLVRSLGGEPHQADWFDAAALRRPARDTRLNEERDATRHHEVLLAARMHEQVQFARSVEEQRTARLLKEKMAYESMTEEQKAACR